MSWYTYVTCKCVNVLWCVVLYCVVLIKKLLVKSVMILYAHVVW